ncbi:MAG: iron ABC transporter permease [Thaumarchaeota archaeon]|nr:iron ABC transporter permease [Nitrososphaerota archaeon]
MYAVRWLLVLAIILFALLILPVAVLIVGVSFFPVIGAATFTFVSFITSPYAWRLVASSLEYAIPSAAFTVALATIYCWIVARTDIPARRFFEALPILGLTMPILVKAFAWEFLLNPANGILNLISRTSLGTHAPVFNVESFPGLIFVTAVGGVPLAYLLIMPAMRSVDSSFEEASRVAGRGSLETALSIMSRLLLPALGSAFLLAIIGGLNTFDYPLILGQPAKIQTLATEVYYWTNTHTPPSYGDGGLVSILYMAITLVGVTIYIWFTRRTYRFATITGGGRPPIRQKLRKWRPIALIVCLSIVVLEFILPFSALILVSMTNIYVTGSLAFNFNFPSSYILASQVPFFYQSLSATLEIGIAAAVGATAISAVISYATLRSKTKSARLVEYVTSVPLIVPSIVYGIALFWMFLIVPGFNRLYGTVIPLVISVTFVRLPFAARIISANLVQVSNELEEASQVVGSRFSRTFFRISLPLIRQGLINSFVFVLVDSLRELGAVIILVTPSAYAYTVLLLTYYHVNTLSGNVLAAGSVVLTLIVMGILLGLQMVNRFLGRGNIQTQ